MLRFLALAALVALAPAGARAACNTEYTVGENETIYSIAEKAFGDAEKWTLLFYANERLLTEARFAVQPGDVLILPCEPGSQAADATPLLQDNAEMKLVTGSNYAPFTDRSWPGNGMVTELVNAALEATPEPVSYSIAWEDDWSKHLFPMLDSKQFDMGFPWLKPDCDRTPDNERCANFHFSDPLVEILIMLFVRKDSGLRHDSDADVIGKTLCRPSGYFTHDLDRHDRQWLSKGLVTLVQADTPEACFELLRGGHVDAVTVNSFLGATKIQEMGLGNAIIALERPLSVEGLHVIISKKHWRGTTHLYRLNAGLQALKESDRYNQIIAKHLAIFWDRIPAQ